MMDVAYQALKIRYYKPIQGMLNNFEVTGTIAFLATFVNEILREYTQIFLTDFTLVYSLVTLIFIDLVTGILASCRTNIKINSFALRSSVVKIIEYSVAVISFTILSNMHESLSWIQTWTYIFLCGIEIKSIQENLFLENTNTRKLFKKFWEILKKKNNIDLDE